MAELKNVTVYGAGGDNIGRYILDALIADPAFSVTVLSRKSSKPHYPPSAKELRVADDLPQAELVEALRGQHVVICAVGFNALETQYKVIDAAVEAGVKRFLPSEYGFDNADPLSIWLSPVFATKNEVAKYLDVKAQEHPDFSWTAVATGIWLEWALGAHFLAIDPVNKTVQYWDDGSHAPSHTTLPYATQAFLECLKHPAETKNQRIFLEAFTASQREIVAELEKQQGVKYIELDPVDGDEAVEEAHKRLKDSHNEDRAAALQTVVAGILVEKYGANNVKTGKPLLEDIVHMPKLDLKTVIKKVVTGSW